jgi:hypothetical protein
MVHFAAGAPQPTGAKAECEFGSKFVVNWLATEADNCWFVAEQKQRASLLPPCS